MIYNEILKDYPKKINLILDRYLLNIIPLFSIFLYTLRTPKKTLSCN